jgi:transcriptional regulator with XRE-family HTH domain
MVDFDVAPRGAPNLILQSSGCAADRGDRAHRERRVLSDFSSLVWETYMHGGPWLSTGMSPANPDALKSFLIDRRGRVRPESVGLPARSRRSPGLTRQHIAELLGVSPLWYALFESGTSGRRFSYGFLVRLVGVLRLNDDDREELFELAVTTGHAAADLETAWYRRRLEELTLDMKRCSCAVHDRVRSRAPSAHGDDTTSGQTLPVTSASS